MISASAGDVGRQLGRLFGAGSAVGLTDGELIQRFANRQDESAEAAFETILARHGAMVLSVCRQVLGDLHAAEDAFQATFLVLVRRAGSLRVREPGSLGPWLYGVAYRIALKTRQAAARRRSRERRVAIPAVEDASTAIEDGELRALLHDEVNRLPSKYRAPVVLCYFEGRSHDEAAAALNWPIGTVHSRLNRARDRLRNRLTRRGLAPAGLVGGSWIETSARAEVPAMLRDATIAAAIQDTPAPAIAAMVKLMLRALLLARVKMAAAALGVVLMAAGVGFVLRQALASQPPRRPDHAPAPVAAGRPRPVPDDSLPKFARRAWEPSDSTAAILSTRSLTRPMASPWSRSTGATSSASGTLPRGGSSVRSATPGSTSGGSRFRPTARRWRRSNTRPDSGSGTWPQAASAVGGMRPRTKTTGTWASPPTGRPWPWVSGGMIEPPRSMRISSTCGRSPLPPSIGAGSERTGSSSGT